MWRAPLFVLTFLLVPCQICQAQPEAVDVGDVVNIGSRRGEFDVQQRRLIRIPIEKHISY